MGFPTLSEFAGELREVIEGKTGIADGVLPPLVFVSVNAFAGVQPAAYAGLGVALAIVALRLARRKPLRFAFSGLAGTVLAIALASRTGRAENYFLPGIISGVLTTAIIAISLARRRPAAAYASWVTRGWPIDWYWHPQVLPAYLTATWLWFWFFGARTGLQAWLFATEATTTLGVVRVVTGWPGILGLLAATYVVGRTRLERLAGPSVVEFEEGHEPPWTGQERGF